MDTLNEIWQTLQNNKLRTALTGLAVAWGIFMLIVLLAMGNGVINSFRESAMSPGSQKIEIWSGTTSKPYHGYKEGRKVSFKNDDLDRIVRENPSFAKSTAANIRLSSSVISTGSESVTAGLRGVFPENLELDDGNKLVSGRFINERDMASKSKVMVLQKSIAEQLFPPDGAKALGGRLSYKGLSFQVVGITDGWERSVYIPFSTARLLDGNNDRIDNMSVLLKNVTTEKDGDDAEQKIRETLAAAHDFAPDDRSAVWIWNQFTAGLKGMAAMNILNMSIWILGLLTLISGIVGISNIMFVSVKERTHEIGIRRAIGARPRSILTQILAESVAITTLFGYIGIVLGTATSALLDHLFGDSDFLSHPTVSLSIALQVTAVLIAAGALAGLFPALKALKVKPVEALRDE